MFRFAFLFLCIALPAWPQAETDSVERDYSSELPRIAPTEPKDALGTFTVHEDFQLQLVAAEPLVRDPVAVAFDEAGRMFVAEMTGYSEKRDEVPGDVRLLEDTDGDGVFDKGTTYATDIPWPVAVACYDGGIFVGAAPDILYFKDTDGDGVADVRRVVYSGFKLNNVQGMLNSFNWGLDHRIHGSSSANGGEIGQPEVAGAPVVALRGRDFAFDPRSLVMAAEAGGAQHGMSFDDWGRRFVCSNSDHIQLITYDDRYAARNPRLAAPGARISIAADGPAADVFRISPVEPWRIVRTRLRVKGITPGLIEGGGRAAGYFTSATGVTIYRGDAWPEAYRGQAFIGDVGGNLVHRKILDADGTVLSARRADTGREFIASTDIWFRPVQFANAPDGNLYILDMYREVIEHPDSLPPVIKKHLDLSSGSDRGRIYRIATKDFKAARIPNLGERSSAELVALLAHPNAWHRETAARLIHERQDASIARALAEMAVTCEAELGRLTALYALLGLEKADAELQRATVQAALEDSGGHVREHAILLSERWLKDAPELQAELLGMAKDAEPLVRFQLAFSLGEFDHAGRAAALAELALRAGDDARARFSVLASLRGDAVGVFTAYLDGLADGPDKEMLAALAQQAIAAGGDGVETVKAAARTQLAGKDGRVGRWLVLALGDVIRKSDSAEDKKMLADAVATAVREVQDTANDTGVRVDAMPFLAYETYDAAAPVLGGVLARNEAPEVQRAAMSVLTGFGEAGVPEVLLSSWPSLGPAARGQAVEALFSRKAWTQALLGAMESGGFSPRDLDSTRVKALLNHADAEIQARAKQVLGGNVLKPREEVVQAHMDVLTMTGDRGRGHEIYAKNCAQCHKVKEEGFAVGPDLATVAQGGSEKILTNLLDPNREVNQQYVNYTVNTKDLETHTGIIAAESAASITLKRGFGETETILRSDIDEMHSEKLSIMPEGLEQTLSKQDLADLIAFLTSL